MDFRRYETLLLFSPDLSEEDVTQIQEKYKGMIDQLGGRMIYEEYWGRRRLSYPVMKQMYGLYYLVDYMGTPALLDELERNLRIDEVVFKYMTQLLDKKFSEEKYQEVLDRIEADMAKRAAEKARREAEMQERAAQDSDDDESYRDSEASDSDDDSDEDSESNEEPESSEN